jgi:hypothetical protein
MMTVLVLAAYIGFCLLAYIGFCLLACRGLVLYERRAMRRADPATLARQSEDAAIARAKELLR